MEILKKHPRIFIGSLIIALCLCFFIAINIGSVKVTPSELFRGLFIEFNQDVASIYNIRFPRVIASMLVGGALALSGLLLQVVLKNPLADPGIIGVSSGASLVATFVMLMIPELYFFAPIFAFIGGMLTFLLIYFLAWKTGLNTTRILLIGVAVNYTLTALLDFLSSSSSTLTSQVAGQLTFTTWSDVLPLAMYLIPFLLISLFLYKACDLLGLEDKTLLSLGINVKTYRFVISLIAVVLCSVSVAIVGIISFVGLIVPHISRLCIGSQHRYLIPVNILLGSLTLLIADTIGRVIIAPYEISSAIIMAIIGGPVFILLLKRGIQHD